MRDVEKTIAVHASTREKLRRIKRVRRWSIKDAIDILADRELAAIKSEQTTTAAA